MTWKKYFQTVPQTKKMQKAINKMGQGQTYTSSGNKFSSFLPEVYQGNPDRIERYTQYEQMDQDSEVNASLDTIADFATSIPENEEQPFAIKYYGQTTEEQVEIINNSLRQWCNLNEFQRRIWKIFRNTIKYGDVLFIRDPNTFKLMYVQPNNLEKVIVDEARGKTPEQYVISDLDLNTKELVAFNTQTGDQFASYPGAVQTTGMGGSMSGNVGQQYAGNSYNQSSSGRFDHSQNAVAVDASHIVHLSLSEGMDSNWPFGNSILESIYKVFKQKELLEDSVIIYRVQRAPERRVFYIDVGQMPPHMANSYLNQIKNEIHQRRIPNRSGGGNSIQDAAYNPLSMMEDYFFSQSSDGRGSKVETLPGGESIGELDDLKYFDNKMKRGLRVPSSYLPTGPEDGTASYNDGRVGTAYIQEYRFSKYCKRLQNLLKKDLDREFKMFLKSKGVSVDASTFELDFHEPQNFSKFRQIEIDSAQISVYQPLTDQAFFSRRFLLERFLGLTEEEIIRNEKLWLEENPEATKATTGSSQAGEMTGGGLEDVGLSSDFGDEDDIDLGGEDEDLGDLGGETSPLGGPGGEETGTEETEEK